MANLITDKFQMWLIKFTYKHEMYVKYTDNVTLMCLCYIKDIPIAQTVQGHGFNSQRIHELIKCRP